MKQDKDTQEPILTPEEANLVIGAIPLQAMIDDAAAGVIKAAISYVDYFFPPRESGEGMVGVGGELVRAVRALQARR